MKFLLLTLVGAAVLCPAFAHAQAQGPARVELPLSVYESLTGRGQSRTGTARAGYAFGAAEATVTVGGGQDSRSATVSVTLPVRVLSEEWVAVPLVPAGTTVVSATVDGTAVVLVSIGGGLGFVAEGTGVRRVQLSYEIDVRRFESGSSLPIPLPNAATTTITATLPGIGLGAAIIGASRTRVVERGGGTELRATVAGGGAAHLSWRGAVGGRAPTLSRAVYRGTLSEGALAFEAEFGVELGSDDSALVPLLPSAVALGSMQVDGVDAPITISDGRFAAMIRGRGRHLVRVTFEVPVVNRDGLPGIDLSIAEVPVSRFEISLPGDKEVTVTPASAVRRSAVRGTTVATFLLAMTDTVSLSWPEAVPEVAASEVEARANAAVYHIAHAEEGVLKVRAVATVEVTRGRMSQFELAVPDGVLVNDVTSAAGEVADWRLAGERDRTLTVFLDRAIEGEFTFQVEYERAIDVTTAATEAFAVPILSLRAVQRQRGMVALLATRNLTLVPGRQVDLTRVGENQLPGSVRDSIDRTVAHTFRYVDTTPHLAATTAAREREEGRFDAQVDTLVSLGDVTTTGSATVDVHVKSGSLMDLVLALPEGVNFLDLSAPSLREHRLEAVDGRQLIRIAFTQEMEGQFRVQVSYERISAEGEGELSVPTLHVEGADVEHGRIAIEALAAVQVDPATMERLSPIDVSALPEGLVLGTSNPILLAYRYAHAAPPPVLDLTVTRHREIEMQEATIDEATYRTLYTEDGLAVTMARFTVRNQRKQFLRVALPSGSEVWSARVNGQPETPAMAADDDNEAAVLINIIHSTQGFPVELVYATQVDEIGTFGRVFGTLPRPDVIVTRSIWEVYLPANVNYGEPGGDLTLTDGGAFVSGEAMAFTEDSAPEGLRIAVPAEGLRFTFEKLYAGEGDASVELSIPYTSGWGSALSQLFALIGTLLLWLGALGIVLARFRSLLSPPDGLQAGTELSTYRDAEVGVSPVKVSAGAIAGLTSMVVVGVALLALSLGYLSVSATVPIVLSLLFALGSLGFVWRHQVRGALARLRAQLSARPAAVAQTAGGPAVAVPEVSGPSGATAPRVASSPPADPDRDDEG